MKRIKFLALLAFAAFTAVSFNACKGDDDGDDDNKDNGVVFTEKDGSQYSQSLSELKDNGSELSYTLTIKYIKPVEAKEEYAYRFVYKVENDSLPQSSDSTIVSAVMEITCGSAEAAEALRDSMMIDDADSYDMTIDGNKLICNFKEKELEGLTYSVVKIEYYDWVEEIEDQRKKNEAEKAAEQNKTTPEEAQPSTNSKNSRLDLTKDADETKNDTSAITMTYVKASAGQGVAYNYKLNEDGTFASGTVVVAFKNADDAKAYAKSESRAKDEDGDRIYKSVSIDGGNVVLTYSQKAIANMTEESAKALFNEMKAEIGASTPSTPEENNGANNGEGGEPVEMCEIADRTEKCDLSKAQVCFDKETEEVYYLYNGTKYTNVDNLIDELCPVAVSYDKTIINKQLTSQGQKLISRIRSKALAE